MESSLFLCSQIGYSNVIRLRSVSGVVQFVLCNSCVCNTSRPLYLDPNMAVELLHFSVKTLTYSALRKHWSVLFCQRL